jgi:hypothetical protein
METELSGALPQIGKIETWIQNSEKCGDAEAKSTYFSFR